VRQARALNPWNAAAASYEARLAETSGRHDDAVALYAEAASLSQRPWLEHFRAARARAMAGDTAGSRRACAAATAANPTSELLRERCTALSRDVADAGR
jgi:hypothetical protein